MGSLLGRPHVAGGRGLGGIATCVRPSKPQVPTLYSTQPGLSRAGLVASLSARSIASAVEGVQVIPNESPGMSTPAVP